jgi:hypothetical protein
MMNDKLLMEAVPFGQYYNTPAAGKYNLLAFSKSFSGLAPFFSLYLY